MKILHVISAPAAGGAEIYVKDLAKELVKHGHTVHIVFVEHARDVGRSTDFEEKFLSELDAAAVSYFFLGRDMRKKPWLGILRMRRYVKEHRIDLYHAHLTYGIVFGALLNIPRIYTHHNIKMRVNRFLFSLMSPMIDHLVGISKVCAKRLSDHTKRDVTTVFNAVDPRRIVRAESTLQLPNGKLKCIAVGTIGKQKNYELLVAALSRLPSDIRSKLIVHIAGEGPDAEISRLMELINVNGLGDTVRFLGNRDDVPILLSQSHLFLMSSSYEGLPIALIEASLTGLPCVVTDVGGCGEVIRLCENGVVVDPNSEEAFAGAIARMFGDAELRVRYSTNALRKSSIFSIARSCGDHLKLYGNALN